VPCVDGLDGLDSRPDTGTVERSGGVRETACPLDTDEPREQTSADARAIILNNPPCVSDLVLGGNRRFLPKPTLLRTRG